jgi:hypothetical protein
VGRSDLDVVAQEIREADAEPPDEVEVRSSLISQPGLGDEVHMLADIDSYELHEWRIG